MNPLRFATGAVALGAALTFPVASLAESSDHRTFDGTVVHVSTLNVKVRGLEGGKRQILSFVYLPKLGKASPIYHIHAGENVRVTFDQDAGGTRHVDKITPVTTGHSMKM